MEAITLKAELRNDFGKNANNRLRASGFVPAIVYSHGKSQPIKITEKALFNLFKGKISENIIFDLQIPGDDDITAFVKTYQTDPVSDQVIHLDLFKVTKGEKIQTKVPLEFVGTPIGIKSGGFIEYYVHELDVECLAKDLPGKIAIDISTLDLEEKIHAKDIDLAEGVKMTISPELVIIAVHSPKSSIEETDEETDEETELDVAEETKEKQ